MKCCTLTRNFSYQQVTVHDMKCYTCNKMIPIEQSLHGQKIKGKKIKGKKIKGKPDITNI
ncbi:MAG: hypothetical protein AYK19_03730 [Theionarchaea archaeon DG-70-1]|nr:MAG: hypothetical protein AYK19_03730 [Theionarchaea archaeon DG-70-1]